MVQAITWPATAAQSSSDLPPSAGLTQLPNEMLQDIASFLPNRDVKSLRLVCKQIHSAVQLRFERVFISANPRNLEVFSAVAAHEDFRKQVVEIVWDDTKLCDLQIAMHDGSDTDDDEDPAAHSAELPKDDLVDDDDNQNCPRWFALACVDYIQETYAFHQGHHDEPLESLMPLQDSYIYWKELRRQEEIVLERGDDLEVFRRCLSAFPALRRVTFTPIAHFEPLSLRHPTPMIRSFPLGFKYPMPIGWIPIEFLPLGAGRWGSDQEKSRWRSFCSVVHELTSSTQKHHVTELVLDVHSVLTGLNCHIFDEPSPEYDDLKVLLGSRGFKRLDLALDVSNIEHDEWEPYGSGLLKEALALSSDLEHFYFQTNMHIVGPYSPDLVRLVDLFPIIQWPRLKHFGLSGFSVREDDLFSFLDQLPPSIQKIELTSVRFLEGNPEQLLTRLRDRSSWPSRDTLPKLSIGELYPGRSCGFSRRISDKIDAFLYRGAENPFSHERSDVTPVDTGGSEQDFDRPYTLPNHDRQLLKDLGYLKEGMVGW